MRIHGKALTGLAALGLAAVVLGGCSSEPKSVSSSWVRSNLTPELQSVAHSAEQRKNMHARTYDTNLRQVWDDWDTFWMIDRPTQMSKYPIP
jgi:hypothetical protein